MSSQRKRLPHEIDPFRLAESRAVLEGTVPLKQFKRLRPLLVDDSGVITVVLNFDIDELGVPCVTGKIKAELGLVCQRCLERYDYPIDQEILLAWIRSDKEAENLPLRYEPYLVETNPLILNDVIEDELLLALPQIPMHEESECSATEWINKQAEKSSSDNADKEADKDNPFSVLESLKSKD
ncbi:MAG: YceD family protein [Thioalkalispiraceae bacterium]|jgi:uncharacterized protein